MKIKTVNQKSSFWKSKKKRRKKDVNKCTVKLKIFSEWSDVICAYGEYILTRYTADAT